MRWIRGSDPDRITHDQETQEILDGIRAFLQDPEMRLEWGAWGAARVLILDDRDRVLARAWDERWKTCAREGTVQMDAFLREHASSISQAMLDSRARHHARKYERTRLHQRVSSAFPQLTISD